jgi:hypothetical protein
MYAIQGNNIRWFFTPEEDEHLFATFAKFDGVAEIAVRGNWNEGLSFTPVIRKGRASNDPNAGSFPIVTLQDHLQQNIKTITVPVDYLKLSRQFISTLEPIAIIRVRKTLDRHELTVYPKIVESVQDYKDERKSEDTPSTAIPDEIAAEATEVSPDISKPIVDQIRASESDKPNPISTNDTNSVGWAFELINEINTILANHPDITVTTENDGKSIKFVRRIVTRRQIV